MPEAMTDQGCVKAMEASIYAAGVKHVCHGDAVPDADVRNLF